MNFATLGVTAWHTVNVHEDDPVGRSRRETALGLWCNSTLAMLLHANGLQQLPRKVEEWATIECWRRWLLLKYGSLIAWLLEEAFWEFCRKISGIGRFEPCP